MTVAFSFEKLKVYNKAINLVSEVYTLTKLFPKAEIFGLTDQIRRASVSIALNLAEGSSRSKKEFCRFIDVSRGSAFECVAVLCVALNERYISKAESDILRIKIEEISRMLSGLKASIRG